MNRPALLIRSMTLSDLDQVLEIERKSFPTPWTRSLFQHELMQNRLSHYRVVVVDPPGDQSSSLVAQGGAMFMGEESHILTIAVDPRWRGQRIGLWLLLDLLALCHQQGAHRVNLEVRPGNQVARRLYNRLGFQVSGRRRRYYPDGEDALIMTLEDLDRDAVWMPLASEFETLTGRLSPSHTP